LPVSPLGFTKRARLLTRSDFDRVFAQASRSVDDCFTVLARPNGGDGPRLGLAIARKHARAAVARNRIKRLVRESFRHHQQRLGAIDLVVLGRHGLADRDNAQLRASLERHWIRLQNRCNASSSC
jgi:ribonuclease P protein component